MTRAMSWLKRRWIKNDMKPQRLNRRRLTLESLEDRVVPATIQPVRIPFQFDTTGTFTTSGDGVTQTTTSPVTLSYISSIFGSPNVLPILSFPDGLQFNPITDVLTTNGGVATVGASGPGPIFATGATTPFSFNLVPNFFSSTPTLLAGKLPIPSINAVPYNLFNGDLFVAQAISINQFSSSGEIDCSGVMQIPGIANGGIAMDGKTAPLVFGTGFTSVFQLSNVENLVPFSLDPNNNPGPFTFQLGGVTFQSTQLYAQTTDGKNFQLAGLATAQLPGISFTADFGSTAIFGPPTGSFGRGINFGVSSLFDNNGALAWQKSPSQLSFDTPPITNLTLGSIAFSNYGVGFEAQNVNYDPTSQTFSMFGPFVVHLSANSNTNYLLALGGQTPLSDPKFESESRGGSITVTAGVLQTTLPVPSISFGGLNFVSDNSQGDNQGLFAHYNDLSTTFTVSGLANALLQGGSASVNLGANGSTGILVQNANTVSASFTLTTLTVGSLVYTPAAVDNLPAMTAIYDPNSSSYSFEGGATLFGVGTELGTHGTAGFVLDSNGNITASSFFFNTPNTNFAGVPITVPYFIANYDPTSGDTLFHATGTIQLAGQNIHIDGTGSNYILGFDSEHDHLLSFAILDPIQYGPFTLTPVALIANINNTDGSIYVTGSATTTLGGTILPVTLTQANGLVIGNGVVQSYGFTTPSITVNGVNLQGTSNTAFAWSYNAGSNPTSFAIQGTFNYVSGDLTLGPITGSFAYTADPVQGGVFTQTSNFIFTQQTTINDLVFSPGALNVAFSVGQPGFFFSGSGTYFGVPVTVGGPGLPSVSITNGELNLQGFTPPPIPNIVLPDIGTILVSDLTQVTNPDLTVTFTGSKTVHIGSSTLHLNLGGGGTSGLVVGIQNGQPSIIAVGAQLVGSFTVKNVSINVESLTLQYDVASNTYTINGTANAKIKAASQTIKLELQLGDEKDDIPGIVIANGQLQSLEASITSDFTLFGVKVHIMDAGVAYDSTDSSFGIFGTVTLTTAKKGGVSVLNNFGVSLGSGPNDPGIKIVDGSLQSLDIKLDGTINIGSLTAQSKGLDFKYDAGMGTLDITGGLQVTIAKKFTGEVLLPGDGLEIDTSDGSVQLNGLEIKVADVTFGSFGIQKLVFKYEVDSQGNTTISGAGMVSLPGSITVGGSFEIVNGQPERNRHQLLALARHSHRRCRLHNRNLR